MSVSSSRSANCVVAMVLDLVTGITILSRWPECLLELSTTVRISDPTAHLRCEGWVWSGLLDTTVSNRYVYGICAERQRTAYLKRTSRGSPELFQDEAGAQVPTSLAPYASVTSDARVFMSNIRCSLSPDVSFSSSEMYPTVASTFRLA